MVAVDSKTISVPKFYKPWPHQVRAWGRRRTGLYEIDAKLWCRQAGKDTDDIQWNLKYAWLNPGKQSAYIGLDNVWINNNIFKKYIDNRTHWMDYPEEYIDVVASQKEVYMTNNPDGVAPSRIKFIGFLNDEGLVGSSYDHWTISEASLYSRNAFQYIRPIWDRKRALGTGFQLNLNGTPRGTQNVYYDLLRAFTGVEDPKDFPGAHGNCYVDLVTIEDLMVPDPLSGGYKHLYTPEDIEKLKSEYLREYGDLNLFYQENYCDFTKVNSGLIYKGIEQLIKDGRYCDYNLDTEKPVYMAWDISSKGKVSDATACIVFQYINGRMIIFDWFEARGMSLVECVQELAKRDYFHLIRFAALPWDSDRSASSETPLEECKRMFPNINWHALEQERVDRGIQLVRGYLKNMIINAARCRYVREAFESYEYKRLSKEDNWTAKPRHDRWSHIMDAVRYAAMAIKEIDYLQLNSDGAEVLTPSTYGYFDRDSALYAKPSTMRRVENLRNESFRY